MTARIASITDIRARASRREQLNLASSRLAIAVVVLVAVMLVVGLGAILSASSADGILGQSDRLASFRRQLRWVVVGLGAMVMTGLTPYALYKKMAVWILGGSMFGLILVPIIGSTRGGAERWIQVGSITVQPSEFSKLAVIFFLAAVLADREDRLDDIQQFLGPILLSVGVTCFLVAMQPDLGTALIVAGAGGGVILASRIPGGYIVVGGVLAIVMAALSTIAYPYRRERFACFFDPLSDPLGSCYQLAQSLMAVGSGHLTGVGLGASRARWAFLPNANTDFIFTIIAEETGFVGAIGLIVVLTALSIIGIWIAYRAGDPFARLVASGITAWIGVQSIVNIGGVVGVIPVTGLALPFVSVGGSAMLAALAGAGILVNIARTAPHRSEVEG